jgi:hypothetical protein
MTAPTDQFVDIANRSQKTAETAVPTGASARACLPSSTGGGVTSWSGPR